MLVSLLFLLYIYPASCKKFVYGQKAKGILLSLLLVVNQDSLFVVPLWTREKKALLQGIWQMNIKLSALRHKIVPNYYTFGRCAMANLLNTWLIESFFDTYFSIFLCYLSDLLFYRLLQARNNTEKPQHHFQSNRSALQIELYPDTYYLSEIKIILK